MKKTITNFTQRWPTLFKLNSDVKCQSEKLNIHSKRFVKLTNPHKFNDYAKQVRYMNYMGRRIDHFLDNQNWVKALWITETLILRSESMRNLSFMHRSQLRRLKLIIAKEGLIRRRNNIIDRFLSEVEKILACFIVLLIAGAEPLAEATTQVTNASENLGNQGLLLFITIVITMTTILMQFKNEELIQSVITGPMTESEYEWLQETLAYNAWLDNLAISPIGELWRLPF